MPPDTLAPIPRKNTPANESKSTALPKKSTIIICATQRCGSTLVCEDLRNNDLGCAEEHFLRVIGPQRKHEPAEAARIVEDAARGPNGIASVKVMSSYADQVNAVLADLPSGGPPATKLWPTFHERYKDALWIYIDRRSALRQAVSRLMARHTGINHAVASETASFVPGRSQVGTKADYNQNVPFHPSEIEWQIVNIAAEKFLWEEFFEQHGLAPIRITYEDIANDPGYIAGIRAAMGLPEAPVVGDRKLLKLANERTEQIIARFLEERVKTPPPPKQAPPEKQAESPAPTLRAPAAPAPSAPVAQSSGGSGLTDLQQETAVVARRWAETPYYNSVEQRAREQWESLIWPSLKDYDVDFSSVLELAVGHGRMTQILLEKAGQVIGIDVLQENIDFCRERFANATNLTLLRNDGVKLDGVADGAISFAFCFDSMVHFDSDVVRSYLAEFHRVLKPGALAFCHHSNLTRNPAGNFQRAAHARNFMSQALFHHYAHKEGLRVVKSEVIDWGTGAKHVRQLDCLSLLWRPN